MSQINNSYYIALKDIIDTAIGALADSKVSMSEAWACMLVLGDAAQTVFIPIISQDEDFDVDRSIRDMKEAVVRLYDEYVRPLDLPGPDHIVDPILRNVVLPGIVDGAYRIALARNRASESGGRMSLST